MFATRTQPVPSRAVKFAWLVALVAVAAWAGRWATLLAAPRPVASLAGVPAAPPTTADDVLKVFGKAAASSLAGVELTGVYAQADGVGFAAFATRGGGRVTRAGEEVEPGVRLVAVAADRVTLRAGGAERELVLKTASAVVVAPAGR